MRHLQNHGAMSRQLSWSAIFEHLVACIVADALGLPTFHGALKRLRNSHFLLHDLELREVGSACYWVDCFCFNMHDNICGHVGVPSHDAVTGMPHPECTCRNRKRWKDSELCEIDKSREVIRAGRVRMLVVVDETFAIFQRVWCIAEMIEAKKQDIPVVPIVLEHFAPAVCEQFEFFDIRQSAYTITRLEDKDMVLSEVPDLDEFNRYLRHVVLQAAAPRSENVSSWRHLFGWLTCRSKRLPATPTI